MTWPTQDTDTDLVSTDVSSGSAAGAPAAARSSLFLPLVARFNNLKALVNSVINFGEPALKAEALPDPQAVTFAASLTVDASLKQVFYIGALTANVTSMTVSNAHDGRPIMFRFVQDATGSRTVAMPSGALVAGLPNSQASKVSWLTLMWVNSASRFEGFWSALP